MDKIESQKETWERLREIVDQGNSKVAEAFIDTLTPAELARGISRLNESYQSQLLTLLSPEEAADLIEELPEAQAVDLIEDLEQDKAAAIVDELTSELQADLLGSLDEEDAEAILKEMDPEEARDARQLLSYEEGTAGSIMVTEFLSYTATMTVSEILQDLRQNAEEYKTYDVLYAYIVSKSGKLVGVLKLRDLLLSSPDTPVHEIMIKHPIHVTVSGSYEELDAIFDRYDFFGVPVTDSHSRFIGVVRRASLREAREEEADFTYLRSAGIWGGEELRSLPLRKRSFRRLSILTVNIFLNILSASVIAYYHDTLSAVIALAVFLPIISDLSGCSGNQSIAVSIRELSLGLIKPKDFWLVFFSEARVGLINGIGLGVVLGLVAWFWYENPYLGIVVGGALALNTVVAVVLGGILPLFLKKIHIDPAIASSPALTTLTDAFGFFLVLSLATLMLSHLSG